MPNIDVDLNYFLIQPDCESWFQQLTKPKNNTQVQAGRM